MENKLEGIQMARGLAACMVVVHHIYNNGWLPGTIIDFGAFGVDLFFVISGFIMCLTLKLPSTSPTTNALIFLIKRTVRIFPLYLVVSLPLILYFALENNISQHITKLIGNIFLIPSFSSTTYNDYGMILPPGWTLVYEMLFYYLFALSILFFNLKNKIQLFVAGFIFFVVVWFNIFGNKNVSLSWVNINYIVNNLQILNFSLGIICYYIFSHFKEKIKLKYVHTLLISGVLCFILMLLMYLKIPNKLITVFCAFLIISSLTFVHNSSFNTGFVGKVFLMLGNASYSIYLIHHYFDLLKLKILNIDFINTNSILTNLIGITLVLISIVSGIILYKYVEKPLLNQGNKMIKKVLPKNITLYLR